MERLKMIKEKLMSCIESQLGDLTHVNAEELGEVVDMVKDLEETIYYCTVVKAMEDKEKEPSREMMYYPVMYYNGGGNSSSGGNSGGSGSNGGGNSGGGSRGYSSNSGGNDARGNGRGYSDGRYYYPMYSDEPYYYGDAYARGMRDYANVYPKEIRDYREGRSGNYRRSYMESKEMREGKEKQMVELDKYMKELSGDIMEMLNDATPEEKEILSNKLNTLAEKIK